MTESIESRASFDLIRYANCWEDADILVKALRPRRGTRYLSIASGGDNSFSLLAAGAEVLATDLSAVQMAVCETKRAAFGHLDYDDLLAFLGVREHPDRSRLFQSIAHDLPDDVREFWASNPAAIEDGLIHAGKFESYFRKFRIHVLPWIHSQQRIKELLEEKSLADQNRFYGQKWNSFRWRLLFRVFFSRFVMGRLGRDPEFFRYVQGSVSGRILERTRHALTEIPTHSNPYLTYILTGNYGNALPHYLREENFERIRENLAGLQLVRGSVQQSALDYGDSGFDGFNLSDIFEYLAPDLCEEIYRCLLNLARPQARFAYWNMLVPRQVPDVLADQVEYLDELSHSLFLRDKAWFYCRFVVEEKS